MCLDSGSMVGCSPTQTTLVLEKKPWMIIGGTSCQSGQVYQILIDIQLILQSNNYNKNPFDLGKFVVISISILGFACSRMWCPSSLAPLGSIDAYGFLSMNTSEALQHPVVIMNIYELSMTKSILDGQFNPFVFWYLWDKLSKLTR